MEELLQKIGLTEPQAKAYLFMMEYGSVSPPALAKRLKLTRTNTYKVLDQLVELGLVTKSEVKKKLTYFPEDPIALASIVAEERNRLLALEDSTKQAVSDLRSKYKRYSAGPFAVKVRRGNKSVIDSFEKQAKKGHSIYFVKTRADIPVMGFEIMDYIRKLPQRYGNKRYGITPDSPESPLNPDIDKRTNLERTWVAQEDYTAPVEWTASDEGINIVVYDKEPSVIQITHPIVAESFIQIWKLMNKNLQANPGYRKMPQHAKREV